MNLRRIVLTASVLAAPLSAQTAADHIALGDREHAAMNAAGALRHYQAAIRIEPANAEALWRASREATDLGEFDPPVRDSLYRLGEEYARRAVQADPRSSVAHFALARALGRRALALGARDRVRFAAEVRQEALESLRLDSTNAGAMAVLGMWHANVMRLSGVARFVARNLLGGRVFAEASWAEAIAWLERAAAAEPGRIVHRLNLGAVYEDVGDRGRAGATYEHALRLSATDFNDRHYLRQAEEALRRLR